MFFKLKMKIKYVLYWLFFRVFAVFPIRKNKIVFIGNASLGRNPQLLYEELLRNDVEQLDIVLALTRLIDVKNNTRVIYNYGWKYLLELATAKVWISDSRLQAYYHKRKGQLYFMLWHGCAGLKKIEKDTEETLPPYYIKCAKNDSKNTDIMVADTQFLYNIMKNSFWYDGTILQAEFVDKKKDVNSVQKVRDYYGINKECSLILYVPTFRKLNSSDCYNIDYERVVNCLNVRFEKEHAFVIRFHENNAHDAKKINYNDHIFNGTYYPKIDELIDAADYIISDYSSCLFEGYRRFKKVFIYAPDYEEYVTKDRGMYYNMYDLPSPISQNTDQLIDDMVGYDEKNYIESEKKINDSIGYYEDDAAAELVRLLCESLPINPQKVHEGRN